MSALFQLNCVFLCSSCCSRTQFVTLKKKGRDFSYLQTSHIVVPQGRGKICISSLHLRFISEHNMVSGDLWQRVSSTNLTSFVPSSIEELVPMNCLSVSYTEYPEHKRQCFVLFFLFRNSCFSYENIPCVEQHRLPLTSIVLGCFWF